MKYKLCFSKQEISGSYLLPASKSISNRLLIIKSIATKEINIQNLSNAEDTTILKNTLTSLPNKINTGNGGTTTRFLIALLSALPGVWNVTASNKMRNRPISQLVSSLRELGAKINYTETPNYLPIKIHGGYINKSSIVLPANISSQFISAILLISPLLKQGIEITLSGKIVSKPYINMTLSLMKLCGINSIWENNTIKVLPGSYTKTFIDIENDWSSASFWYSMAALSKKCSIKLMGLSNRSSSIQGDSFVIELFKKMGVLTTYYKTGIHIQKSGPVTSHLEIDFIDYPDLALPVITTATALGITGKYSGLETLQKKESFRVNALCNELTKIGAKIKIEQSNQIEINQIKHIKKDSFFFNTYDDHRVAMSFAPLAMKYPSVQIENPIVVNKSYPNFWNEIKKAGFTVEEVNEH